MTRALDLVIDAVIIAFAAALVATGCCIIDPKDCVTLRPHCLEAVDAGPE